MNSVYYISNGKTQEGPFNKEELIGKNITSSTLVWREGLEGWLPIIDVVELNSLSGKLPPPLPEVVALSKLTVSSNIAKEKESSDMPDNVSLAGVLYTFSIVVGLFTTIALKNELISYYNYIYGWGSGDTVYNMSLWGSAIIWIIYIILLYHRQNWARITYLVFFIIGLLFMPLTWKVGKSIDIPGIWISVGMGIINLIATILLFMPSSNKWFSRK